MRKLVKRSFFGFAVFLLAAMFTLSSCETDSEPDKDPPVYSVGDTGPAGGLIFHVEDNGSDYTYYEAAPEDCSGEGATWKPSGTYLSTQTAVGTGKSNTALMLAADSTTEGSAAVLCAAYKDGGKDDWFIPSYLEMKLMNDNLHKAGKGSFSTDKAYWTSSEANMPQYGWNWKCADGKGYSTGKGQSCLIRVARSFN
jgi:hypothetical protein